MRLNHGLLAIALSVSMLGVARALPVPTLQYDTWPATGTAVVNTGSSAIAGTLLGGTTTYPTGPDDGILVPPNTAAHFNDGNNSNSDLGSGINSGQTLNSLTGNGTSVGNNNAFTMGAWVNLDNTNGDNMVFGTNGGAPMHLGFRNDQAWFGFWGNDSASASLGSATLVGHWNYFTWVYDPNGGHQKIYENGGLLSDSAGHGGPSQVGQNLTVGTTNGSGGGGGDLGGAIDDARIYNTAFTDAQVSALFASSSIPDVPEPSSIVLAGLGLTGLLAAAYRRRKSRR